MNAQNKFDTKNYEFNKESSTGVYIIHGFTNSTYEVKELAIFLSKKGFYTRADNLPGHATNPEDCNKFLYTDWIEFVEQGLAEMSNKCDNLYVIGISMGSLLAMNLCSIFPINGAVFASIAIKFQDQFGVRILTPLLHKIIRFRKKGYSYPKKTRLNMKFLGYKVWPMSAVNQMRKLTNFIKPKLKLIKCPSLLIHSNADMLCLKENLNYVYNNISSKKKEKLFVNNASHNLFLHSLDQSIIFEKILHHIKKSK